MLNNLQECGNLILRINEAAYETHEEDFQARVLSDIDRVIGFDRAWWGIMSPVAAGGFRLLSSYRANLPASYVETWDTCTPDDRLASSVSDAPTHTVRFDTHQLHSTPGLYEINAGVGNQHALCTAIKLAERPGDFLFVSLFRGGRSPAFDASEAWAKQFLMPHVFMGWRHNLGRNQERADAQPAGGLLASAFVDLQWGVIEKSAGFQDCVTRIWPAWAPPALPPALVSALRRDGARSVFSDLVFSIEAAGALQRLSIRRLRAIDRLTPRESDVARAFSSGQSYKEVARALQLSPATVRHYLREIYIKLGLTDKAELASLLNAP